MRNSILRLKTVKLLVRLMKLLVEEGVRLVPEELEIESNLKNLTNKGRLMCVIVPKLIDQREAAEMLGLRYSNFKKLEKRKCIPVQSTHG